MSKSVCMFSGFAVGRSRLIMLAADNGSSDDGVGSLVGNRIHNCYIIYDDQVKTALLAVQIADGREIVHQKPLSAYSGENPNRREEEIRHAIDTICESEKLECDQAEFDKFVKQTIKQLNLKELGRRKNRTSEDRRRRSRNSNNNNKQQQYQLTDEQILLAEIKDSLEAGSQNAIVQPVTTLILKRHHFKTMKDSRQIYYYFPDSKSDNNNNDDNSSISSSDIRIEVKPPKKPGGEEPEIEINLAFKPTGIYYKDGETVVREEIIKICHEVGMPHSIREAAKNEILNAIRDSTLTDRELFDGAPDVVCLKNCLVNVLTGETMKHTPNYPVLSSLPIRYDPEAECVMTERFLQDVMSSPDILREILKFCAYTLLGTCRYEKGLLLLGNGANGKTIFILLMETVHGGHRNCAHVSLQDLENDKFRRIELFARRLNTFADLKSTSLKDAGYFKICISGDSMDGQEKFKPTVYFRNKSKFIISSNNPPQLGDDEDTSDEKFAFYRRWKICEFTRTFVHTDDLDDPNRADPEILSKITTARELSGFFNLMLRYVPVLIKEGGFSDESAQAIKEEYEHFGDTVRDWLNENCVIESSGKHGDYFTETKRLYHDYAAWCRTPGRSGVENGLDPLNETHFGNKLRAHGVTYGRRRLRSAGRQGSGNKPVPVYENIVLRSDRDKIKGGKTLYDIAAAASSTTDELTAAAASSSSSQRKPNIIIFYYQCPYCLQAPYAVEMLESGNSPLCISQSLTDVQYHVVLRHPGMDYQEESLLPPLTMECVWQWLEWCQTS